MRNHRLHILIGLLLLLGPLGCATSYRTYKEAQVAEEVGDWDAAVLHYMEAYETDPSNVTYRAALLRSKIRASQEHFTKAKRYQEAGILEQAFAEYQQAVLLDPANQYAQVELAKVQEEIVRQEAARDGIKNLDDLKAHHKGSRAQPPVLNPRSNEPISLDFPEPVSILSIYKALGKAFGINVLFDPNLREQEIAITLKDVIAQDALEILMRAAGHFYKTLDEHSIIIAADTQQNRRNYEDLVIQTFYLSNAEVKDVMTMLRSLVGAKNVAANEQLNAIIMRDTADKVKVAEKIISANDKARAEVVVDVELMQVNSNKLRDLGLSLSSYSVGFGIDLGEGASTHVQDLTNLTQNDWVVTVPSFIVDFVKADADAQLLAKPQLRISEGEKANLHIGDKVPIPVTTFNTGQTVGGNIVPVTSFQYQDIGIKIDLEPRVHHNDQVTLKIKVEVSNISGTVQGTGGQEQPIIGTRTFDSVIRLQDGETNFLAGLIRTDEAMSEQGIPGLSDIPIIGRLFSNKSTQDQRTDVVLTITPHIIRRADITEEDLLPIWAGTEQNITFRGGSPRVESTNEGPFDVETAKDPKEIQDAIRRRLQQLPRGLQQPDATEDKDEAPPGVDLVPPAFPQRKDDSSTLAPGPFGWVIGELVEHSLAALPAVEVTLSGPRAVRPGEVFEVVLSASADRPVSHLPFTLAFDPLLVVVEQVDAGDFLGPRGRAELLADWSHAGRLVVGASRLGSGPGVLGEGVVARIRFRALEAARNPVEWVTVKALSPRLVELDLDRKVELHSLRMSMPKRREVPEAK